MRAVAGGHPSAVVTACWVVAGLGLVASAFLPWVTKGVFATSSPLDAVRLIRTGALDDAVPAGAVVVLLGLPAVGVGIVALTGVDGPAFRSARLVLLVLGALLVAGSLWVLPGAGVSQLASGAWLAIASLASALGAVLFTMRAARRTRLHEDVR